MAFDHIENKYGLYLGEKRTKRFYQSLRENTKNIIDFEEKNVTVNKKRIKITKKCNRVIHVEKNIYQRVYIR